MLHSTTGQPTQSSTDCENSFWHLSDGRLMMRFANLSPAIVSQDSGRAVSGGGARRHSVRAWVRTPQLSLWAKKAVCSSSLVSLFEMTCFVCWPKGSSSMTAAWPLCQNACTKPNPATRNRTRDHLIAAHIYLPTDALPTEL